MKKYSTPAICTIYQCLGYICFALAVLSGAEGGKDGAKILLSGLGLVSVGFALDWIYRVRYEAERAANSLERMEWAAGEPARQREAEANRQAELARAKREREEFEAAQQSLQS